jgi:hypothetical protein
VDLGLLIADLCSTELFLTDEAYESVLTRVRSALIFKKKKKKTHSCSFSSATRIKNPRWVLIRVAVVE